MQTAVCEPNRRKAGWKVSKTYMSNDQWNVAMEHLAQLIELQTGSEEAAKIVRDSKIPVKESKKKPVTPPKDDKEKVTG